MRPPLLSFPGALSMSRRVCGDAVYTTWASAFIHLPLLAQVSLRFWAVWDLLTGREDLDDFLHSHGWLPTSQGYQTRHPTVVSAYCQSSQASRRRSRSKQESSYCLLVAPKRRRVYLLCTMAWTVKGWGRNGNLEETAGPFLFVSSPLKSYHKEVLSSQ